MDFETIILDKRDRIAKITLNRPAVMNAMNDVMMHELRAAVQDVAGDADVGVLILTGAGRAFSAGVDLKRPIFGQDARFPNVFDDIRELEKATIAAVNGYAITGGLELALSCDIIVASENARFADTHVRVGVVSGGGATQLLPRLVGIKKAKEMSFTGNFMTAAEALQFGLVNRVVPEAALQAAAEGLSRDILSNDLRLVAKIKRLIDRGEGMSIEDALMLERYEHLRYAQETSSTPEQRAEALRRGRKQAQGG